MALRGLFAGSSPDHLPYRDPDCCLPATQYRRLSLTGEVIDHDYTFFGAQSRGLRPCLPRLRTSITGFARGGHYSAVGYTLRWWDLIGVIAPTG